MTDNDIKKALECCSNKNTGCLDCSYVGKISCAFDLRKDALDLINRQQAEIEQKQSDYETVRKSGIRWISKCKRLQAEIEWLKEKLESKILIQIEANSRYEEKKLSLIKDIQSRVKSEAIKEFAERLKATDISDLVGEQYINGEIYGYFYNNAFEIKIDNLVKEMTEENENGKV